MVVKHWSLPTLSQLYYHSQETTLADAQGVARSIFGQQHNSQYHQALVKAEQEWCGAIAALENLLLTQVVTNDCGKYQGLLISGPIPLISNQVIASKLFRGIFTPETLTQTTTSARSLPGTSDIATSIDTNYFLSLPLLPDDPLLDERYGLLFTSKFCLVVILGSNESGLPTFHFSFEPELIRQIWATLRYRLVLTNYQHLEIVEAIVGQFPALEPDYRLVMQFSRDLLRYLPQSTPKPAHKTIEKEKNLKNPDIQAKLASNNNLNREIELLQALTHEIRTPLTTIRTLTRLLLRRSQQLSQEMIKRLEMIDLECTGQINRMDLIFKATELEVKPPDYPLQLMPISLDQLFAENIPRWQQQSARRNVVLDIVLPQKLPIILGHPAMLEQVLTNLMDKITKDLAGGGEIKVQITTMGEQLKLELLSSANYPSNPFKSLGKLLMFQPETGSLSLNINVTKNLFNLMGGKLTIRQHEEKGEILTIFLPLKPNRVVKP